MGINKMAIAIVPSPRLTPRREWIGVCGALNRPA